MCGRYNLISPTSQIIEEFELFSEIEELQARYNIAPGQPVPIIKQEGDKRILSMAHWQFIPGGTRDPKKIPFMINARSETVEQKKSFKESFKRRRCIVPANAFYEWKKSAGQKIPFLIKKRDDSLLGLAGIWDRYTDERGNIVESMAILTTTPNKIMKDIHDRMPVILHKEDYQKWLDPGFDDTSALKELLVPYVEDKLEAYTISTKVNKVANEGPEVIEPAEPDQGELF